MSLYALKIYGLKYSRTGWTLPSYLAFPENIYYTDFTVATRKCCSEQCIAAISISPFTTASHVSLLPAISKSKDDADERSNDEESGIYEARDRCELAEKKKREDVKMDENEAGKSMKPPQNVEDPRPREENNAFPEFGTLPPSFAFQTS